MWRAIAAALSRLDRADSRGHHHPSGAGRRAADDRLRVTPEGIALINSYFSVYDRVVAVLALASASRYYLVMTIGRAHRADLRRERVPPRPIWMIAGRRPSR